MDWIRVTVWSGVALAAIATAVTLNHQPEPTLYTILDEHQDCGSGGTDFAGLESCLIERYDWPPLVAERFSDVMRYRHQHDLMPRVATDWRVFQQYAADLRAVYRALGVRDFDPVEVEIHSDSTGRAFSDSVYGIIRDSTRQAWRIDALVGRGT